MYDVHHPRAMPDAMFICSVCNIIRTCMYFKWFLVQCLPCICGRIRGFVGQFLACYICVYSSGHRWRTKSTSLFVWLKSQVHNCFPNPQSTWGVTMWSPILSTMHHLSRFDTSATLEWSVLGSTVYSSNWHPSCIETPRSSYTLQGRLLNRW